MQYSNLRFHGLILALFSIETGSRVIKVKLPAPTQQGKHKKQKFKPENQGEQRPAWFFVGLNFIFASDFNQEKMPK